MNKHILWIVLVLVLLVGWLVLQGQHHGHDPAQTAADHSTPKHAQPVANP